MLQNDSGIAYGIGVLIIFLIVCTTIFIAFSPLINGVLAEFNSQVGDNEVSKQRGSSMAFNSMMWNSVPIWMLLGAFVWAVVRALEAREGAG